MQTRCGYTKMQRRQKSASQGIDVTGIGKPSALRPTQCSQEYALCKALGGCFESSLSAGPW